MILRKTKIVCSMGPTTESVDIIAGLLRAGMNVARFNFSHSNHEYHQKNMERVREASKATNIPVALMLDTKGPEIRTGDVPGDGKINIHTGDTVLITADGAPSVASGSDGESARLSVSWKALPAEVEPGVRILIADGLVELVVTGTDGKIITCVAKNGGALGSRKNVNVIGIHPDMPVITEQDKDDIAFGVKMGIDLIAASFTSTAADVLEIRRYLDSLNSKVRIIAKIENQLGLDNIKEIAIAADGIMVARGDLGVQLPPERIPLAQKQIIAHCRASGKPVITATQMLESMITNPRPTRAELTDVANAIFDGTDAVMLSGETANGAYPQAAVETMNTIALTVENSEEYRSRMRALQGTGYGEENIAETMTRVAYITAMDIRAAAILTPTLTGNTARMLSTFRPEQPILAVTPNAQVQRQLLLNWGVVPLVTKMAENSEAMVQNSLRAALNAGALKISDRVIMVAGVPIISPVMVNTVRVLLVGNILGRGLLGGGFHPAEKTEETRNAGEAPGTENTACRVTGRIVRAESFEEAFISLRRKEGEILVCPAMDMSFVPILRLVDGLIVENDNEISADTMALINPRLVWISRVRGAMKTFESGFTVTLDSRELIVYEGTI